MQSIPMERTQAQVQVNAFVRSVYNWMAIGLALTGFVAYYVANTASIQQVIFGNRIIAGYALTSLKPTFSKRSVISSIPICPL